MRQNRTDIGQMINPSAPLSGLTLSVRPGGAAGDVALWPPVALAPMAGITDLPFRTLVLSFGAGWVVSEMVATGELLTNRPGTKEKTALGLGQARTAVQLAGRDPLLMAEAARMVADMGAALIDINMGCPAKKVVGGLSGSALLREPDLALRLIDAVTGAVDLPVTLKTRLGWDGDCLNTPLIARRAESAGIRMITIHGRTRQQFYTGQADWAAIARIRAEVAIPVIANGDICNPADAATALRLSGAAGVMVGRGARGAPWMPALIAQSLCGTTAPLVPQGAALIAMVAAHHVDMLHFYGRDLGLRVARKHLGWYMDRAGTPPGLRSAVLTAATPAGVHALLPDALAGHGLDRAA
jgi:tRNA-dihydrouridine synthase B